MHELNTSQQQADVDEVIALWAPRAIVAVTVAALLLVVVDAGGPVRGVVTALALLVAPGLAASLVMGPMSLEARVLVSLVGSAVLLTVVAMVMALTGSWSPTAGLWFVASVAIALLLVPLLRSSGDAYDGASDNPKDTAAEFVDSEGEGGTDHDR